MKKILFILLALCNFNFLQAGEWKLIDKDPFGITTVSVRSRIDCADTNNCIAVYWYNLDRLAERMTTDGGKTWFTTIIDTAPSWEQWLTRKWHNPNGVQYPDTNLIIITCEDGTYWITRDRGKNWTINQFDTFGIKASFCDSKHGAMLDWNNLYLTTDGGNNWKIINYKHIDSTMRLTGRIYVPDSTTIFIPVGKSEYSAYFYRTYNWGLTWERFDIPLDPSDLFFFNKTEGYCVSGPKVNTNVYKDQIFYTNNGGETWQKKIDTINKFPRGANGLRRVDFADRLNGIAIGPWYKTYRTIDGGETWLQDTSYSWDLKIHFGYLVDISYPSQHIVFAVDDVGDIHKYEETPTDVVETDNYHQEFLSYVFPNPNEGKMNLLIESKLIGSMKLTVFDLQGNLVYNSSIEKTSFSQQFELNFRQFTNGKYYYTLFTGNNKVGEGKFNIIK
jgi:photosystem II stability/assembly factor-like uncharacterized protein